MTELSPKLNGNPDVRYAIDYFAERSSPSTEDVIRAFNLFAELTAAVDRIGKYAREAYVMCRYMEPAAEDVLSLLLWYPYSKGRATYRIFSETFGKNFEYYFAKTADAFKNYPRNPAMDEESAVNYYIFMRVCDRMLENVVSAMSRKGIPDTFCIWQAYDLARSAYYGQYRQSGEPYLTHPVCAAAILADLGMESHIVAAAILHDVTEDTDVTLRDISRKCGEQIARYVDAVASLHKEYAGSHSHSKYSLDKYDIDAKSFEKLVQAVYADPKMIFALYIKAADRIHNLRTIEVMDSVKQHSKTDETELDYLPLFREFKLNCFVRQIEDLTWKVANPREYSRYADGYDDLCRRNRSHIEEMEQTLKRQLGEDFNRLCVKYRDVTGYNCTTVPRYYLPIEVYEFVRTAVGPTELSPEKIDKRTVPTCDFDVILDGLDDRGGIDTFASVFVKMFLEQIAPTGREIIDFETDNYGRFIVKAEDRYRNVYRLCFCMRNDHLAYNFGSGRGIRTAREEIEQPAGGDTIFVKLRGGELRELPKGSTVLDLAFLIHEEIGLTARSALINERRAGVSSILHDGDRVVIEADTERQDGRVTKFIAHARIGWLKFVRTKAARDKIIRYLESQYEGDSSDSGSQDDALDHASLAVWTRIASPAEDLFPGD